MAKKYISNFTGEEIDARLQEVSSKYGHIEMRFDEEKTMYWMDCYAKESDIVEGISPIESVLIPISTAQGDTFTAALKTSLSNTADIVVTGEDLFVPLNYRSIKISQIGNENAGYRGSVTVEISTDGNTWKVEGTIPNKLISQDLDDNSYKEENSVNIGSFLKQGAQMVRLRAFYVYTNDSGEEKTITTSNVIVGNSVTKTQLKLELKDSFAEPKTAKDVNGNSVKFNVNYLVQGQVQKTAYFKVTDPITKATATTTYDFSAGQANFIHNFISDIAMTHGVKKVEAWLEAQDGLGNTLKSEVLVNRFMVVVDESNTTPYLLLQNVDNSIDNFVKTQLAEYAVYNNDKNKEFNLTFLLTEDLAGDYVAGTTKEYYRLEQKVKAQTEYKLQTTVEIEGEEGQTERTSYTTRFFVLNDGANFMQASTQERNYMVTVDNSKGYTPIAGATFLMNPKVRNNSEANPKQIFNAKNNNAVVESEWENFGFINDGWMTDDAGNKVLRVMAGSKLTIKRNVWAQFMGNNARPASSLTIEIDCAIHNVTNTTDPIIEMTDGTSATFKGIRMNALEGWIMNGSNTSKDDCLFAWEEGQRNHFSFNLNHQVKPNKGDVTYPADAVNKADGTIALARVIMNGDCKREITYNTASGSNEWGTNTDCAIVIGNEGADIDIYSIRIYENKVLDMVEIMQRNRLAALSTSEEKTAYKERNELLGEGGLIDVEKTKNKGKNVMIWHGVLPYKFNDAEEKGWIEIYRYDENGVYLPEYSGTICKETKSLVVKGQGSTAKTYYDWNVQDDQSKVTATIEVPLDKIHSEIHVRIEGDKAYIYGGNLGKNTPIETAENEQAYDYINGKVVVPDGWIDGNGMYRGMGYRVAPNTSLAQKKVLKINYASSMQSHLIGACTTYDLLHRAVVGDTPLQQLIPQAVSAKHTEPMMFFNEVGGKTYFKGMGNYGAGKADKVTWGYVKKQMPMYALIEGSDNDPVMTNFLVPFDKNTAVYSPKGEGWLYNGQQSWDFDLGATTDGYSDGWTTDGTLTDKGKVEVPTALIRDKWADIHNFIYLHSTNLKYFVGTFEDFQKSEAAKDTKYKYWCTDGSQAFLLKRYDFIGGKWIDEGLFFNGVYQQRSIKYITETSAAYNKWVKDGGGDYQTLNEACKDAMAAHMKGALHYFINKDSLIFNYSYVLQFLAGTDNSAKNTYYKISPIGVPMEDSNNFAYYFKNTFGKDFDFTSVHQLYLDGDDMDSILRTNNNAHQTKPYYIERMYPYADDKPNECLYEGMTNQLFNFVERAYSSTGELQNMMNQIMIAMTKLVTSEDKILDPSVKTPVSVWGFMHKYFFNVQRYFPEIAYLEQARIRYEFPQLIGYISSGAGARSVEPISQSLGNQLENELQYVNQRLIYFASYASFGEFGTAGYTIGLSDAQDTFSFTPAAMPDGSPATYTFQVQTHQYMYPSWYEAGTYYNSNQRTKPGQTCTLAFKNSYTGGDAGVGICGINYLTDLGNFNDKSVTGQLIIKGKRLVIFDCMWNPKALVNPSEVRVDANLISTWYFTTYRMRNLKVDLSKLVRLKTVYSGNVPTEHKLPETHTLSSINLYQEHFSIKNCPNVRSISFATTVYMESIDIGQNVGTNVEGFTVQPIVESIYSEQKSSRKLESIHIENVNWTDFQVEALEWYCDVPTCEFKGTIGIKEVSDNPQITAVTWDLKDKFIAKFGIVDYVVNMQPPTLRLLYKQRAFSSNEARIRGNFYTETGSNAFQFEVRPGSIYENNQYKIGYQLSDWTNLRINMDTGLLTVGELSKTRRLVDVKATVYCVSPTGGGYTGGDLSKTIEIWNRPAQVGDLVFYDGTFCSAESWDYEKTPIGRCVYVAPRKADGSINEKYHDPDDVMTRLMVCCKDITASSSKETFSAWQWGAFPISADSEATTEQYSLFAKQVVNGEVTRVPLSIDGGASEIYDVPNLRNLTSSGLVLKNGTPTSNINEETFRDNSDDAILYNNGFKAIAASYACGDGFAYEETAEYKAERKIDDAIASISKYPKDTMVNSGYAKTLRVIAHRNNIIRHVENNGGKWMGMDIPLTYPTPQGNETALGALARCMTELRDWAKGTGVGQLGDTAYGDKWSQLLYPAISACHAYEPTNLKEGEVLADKFKAGYWFLPPNGIESRICYYTYDYESGTRVDRVDSPLGDVLNDVGSKVFEKPSASGHWSVTETSKTSTWLVGFNGGTTSYGGKSSSVVGRALAAF